MIFNRSAASTKEKLRIIENVELAVSQIKKGGMVIMVDDEDRENEGDLVVAAQFANAGRSEERRVG